MEALPRELGGCRNLNKLMLQGNALGSLPEEIGRLGALAELGVQLVSGDAEELSRNLAADTERWGAVIRAANIQPE